MVASSKSGYDLGTDDTGQLWARCLLGIPASRKDGFDIVPTEYTRTMSRRFYQEGGKAAGRFKADFDTVTIKSSQNYEVGNIPRPNVKYPNYNVNNKTGNKYFNGYKYRSAEADEIAGDYVKK